MTETQPGGYDDGIDSLGTLVAEAKRLGGGLILLTYAIHRRDPVFIFGQLSGLFVYVRNLMLVRREVAQIQTSAQGSFAHDSTPAQ